MDGSSWSFLQNIWRFKEIFLIVAFPKNCITQKKIKAKLNTPKEQLFGEQRRANVYNCSSKKFTTLNE